MKEITIEKGWYFSAGTTYGWADEHSREGVGINLVYFNDPGTLTVHVKGKNSSVDSYEVDTQVALEFIKAHKAYRDYASARVGFIPRTLMTQIKNEKENKDDNKE